MKIQVPVGACQHSGREGRVESREERSGKLRRNEGREGRKDRKKRGAGKDKRCVFDSSQPANRHAEFVHMCV